MVVAAAVVSHTYHGTTRGIWRKVGMVAKVNDRAPIVHEIENTIVSVSLETKTIRLRNHKGARARAGE